MEDAILLARCLGSTTLGVEDGLARYQLKRKERAEMIVTRSRKPCRRAGSVQGIICDD